MRSFVIAIGLLAFAASADAKPRRATKTTAAKLDSTSKARKSKSQASNSKKQKKDKGARKRVGAAMRRHVRFVLRGPVEGQSVGACWQGLLREPTRLAEADGYFIRRPYRAFGTRSTVEHVQNILADVVDRFPDIHPIAVGDISAETGGQISEHSSHQSGRDIDIGLIFRTKPDAYPQSFVIGTADNLDLEATFVLVEEFAKARDADGVQMIFLDFDVQRLLYNWAIENGESPDYLARLFQYPHGRGASAGIVRHEPNHADHLHVRFRCPAGDSACRY